MLGAVLIDLDGVLYVEDEPVAGAIEAVQELRTRGLTLRFVTNTTAHSRGRTLAKLERLGFETACHETEHLRRCLIKPLGVVHDADEPSLLGHVGQQAQHGHADQEAIRNVAGPQAKRGPERVPLRTGETLESIEKRRT